MLISGLNFTENHKDNLIMKEGPHAWYVLVVSIWYSTFSSEFESSHDYIQ